MPTINEFKRDYYEFTGLASGSSRQLAFAGIAIIWLFRQEVPNELSLPRSLLFPAALFVLSLAADLLQYFVASMIWGTFHRIKEKQIEKLSLPENHELKAPVFLPWPQLVFFYIKMFCVLVAYSQLLLYIVETIKFK